ncbi:YybH family protein [Dyadobacter crusticola]|uniref:YybH family protein n=1 Tax=Dyadobacter crusticola TaxID=292407 RepID=UPI0004E190B1|nr:nuclear transport factor 2 family protein [Dyadobacter crusticola]
MKRNISVFILLILLACSFKYRTKARESSQPFLPDRLRNMVPVQSVEENTFEAAVTRMQQANLEMANGNPGLFKSMWLQSDDVTIFGDNSNQELKGWKAISASLDSVEKPASAANSYTFEKITSDEGEVQAYLLQKEHYKLANGKTKDLQVTVVFRKENNEWKIVHRHADSILPEKRSARTSK